MKWWKMRQARKEIMEIPRWEEDFKLSALPEHHMFWEYLEVGKVETSKVRVYPGSCHLCKRL